LLDNQAKHDELIAKLVTKTSDLDETLLILAQSHVKHVADLDLLSHQASDRVRLLGERLDSLAKQSAERDKVLDQRITSLVSAIGEYIRSRPAMG
jgi:hypothetical protein